MGRIEDLEEELSDLKSKMSEQETLRMSEAEKDRIAREGCSGCLKYVLASGLTTLTIALLAPGTTKNEITSTIITVLPAAIYLLAMGPPTVWQNFTDGFGIFKREVPRFVDWDAYNEKRDD